MAFTFFFKGFVCASVDVFSLFFNGAGCFDLCFEDSVVKGEPREVTLTNCTGWGSDFVII